MSNQKRTESNKWNNTMQLAGHAIKTEKLKDAQRHFEKALQVSEKCGDPAKRTETLTLLGLLFIYLDDAERSIETFRRAVAVSSVAFGNESAAYCQSMLHLADAYLLSGDFTLAQSNALASLEIAKKLEEQDNFSAKRTDLYGACHTLLARISYKRGDVSQARKWLEKIASTKGWRDEFDDLDAKKFEALLEDLAKPKDLLAPISYRIAVYAPCF